MVRRLLYKISQRTVPVEEKQTNRILLNILDFGEKAPTDKWLKNFDTADWVETLDSVERH